MREIKSAALIGAGAVGAYFIPGLERELGEHFCVVAEGERRERLMRDGIVINGKHFVPRVCTPREAAAAGVELLIVATKYDGLPGALPMIREIASGNEEIIVISAMNGIDSEEMIAEVIGEKPLLYAYMFISSERRGREIVYDPAITKGLVIGEKDPGGVPHGSGAASGTAGGTASGTAGSAAAESAASERALAVKALMDRADIRCRIAEDILTEQWQKFVLNMGNNLPQAILGVGYGAYLDSEHVKYLHDRLFDEVMEVAAAYGITLQYDGNERGRSLDTARYSTLQDLDAGRHTEVEMFAGVLMKKAKEKGIRVPYTDFAYHAIKALEEKNDGKFDYGNTQT
ncbi:MAG: ketopantoate reductase family protein [Lachnospiraceae bacterium]|nr:ketopantoate reductase family protein [Lachnospiraceae bacterium]